jgi:YidC/Oxa1 family membrane protein insertase
MQSMKQNAATSSDASGGSMKAMMYMMPLMSVMFCFSLPAGVGMYWIVSNIFSDIQAMIMNKLYNPTIMAEKIKAEQDGNPLEITYSGDTAYLTFCPFGGPVTIR